MKRRIAALITDSTFIILLAFGLIFLLGQCGCAGTKLANLANTHELTEQKKAIVAQNWQEVLRRNLRMMSLQNIRNQTEGIADRTPSDDILPIAIEALKSQASLLGMITGGVGAFLGGGVTAWWKEILASILTAGAGAFALYERKKRIVAENGTAPPPKSKKG